MASHGWLKLSGARPRQRGAAILLAMLAVTLVASFSAVALWQQWRNAEVEAAERARSQATWLLFGALDWARLVLREDARAGGVDHLAEPWAVPLQEARLSTFLAMESGNSQASEERDAFLSGRITDQQARLNVLNLVENQQLSQPALKAFARLFELLNLPPEQLTRMAEQLRRARSGDSEGAPLVPARVEQLVWLGLSPETVTVLAPYVTVLPERTTVNLNTADARVMCAGLPGLDLAAAQRLVAARENNHFRTVADVMQQSGLAADTDTSLAGVSSRFFEVRGRLRLDQMVTEERSLVQRDGLSVRTIWRERVAAASPTPQ